jgi:heme exporter protein A
LSGPALVLRGVGKRFGAVEALRGVDLDLAPGGALAVLGPNGAGKSTLLRIIAGLSRPTAGEVTLSGAANRRAAVGYLGHASLLSPDLTAHENLVYVGRLYEIEDPTGRATQLLEEEGLTDVAHRRAGEFSRGMSQRLAIARSRVHDPPLLLLDEPHTGLDRASSERLTHRLAALRASGHALVLVTHDLPSVVSLVDAAVILIAGRIAKRVGGVIGGVVEGAVAGGALSLESLEAAYTAALDAPNDAALPRPSVAGASGSPS